MRERKELVMLDTCVFGWAFRDEMSEKDNDKRIAALKRVEKLKKEGVEIVLPTIVLFEFLCNWSKEWFFDFYIVYVF